MMFMFFDGKCHVKESINTFINTSPSECNLIVTSITTLDYLLK